MRQEVRVTPSRSELHVDAFEDCAGPVWNQGQLPEWASRTAIDHSEPSTGFTDAVISAVSVPFDSSFDYHSPTINLLLFYMKCITPLAQILHLDSQQANDHQAPINRNGSMSPSYIEEATVTETSNLNQQAWVTMEQPQLQSAQLATRAFQGLFSTMTWPTTEDLPHWTLDFHYVLQRRIKFFISSPQATMGWSR
ncbi:hypothetical protein FANTH_11930 [Fusarium anthophilum]|uniref:Uncharacterized protein n=1 Tax=Fusarium anthophilum TaxID=48485 RepID=A0A8H5DTF2_9HYPO|nr:hypothetical protein FANTH_11930 [Fusarium anthophilum]